MNQLQCGLVVVIVLLLVYRFACGKDNMCPYPTPRQYEPCCGQKDRFDCLPSNLSACSPPSNGLYLGPRTYWVAYSRLIGNSKAYSLHDVNDWPLTYEQAVREIPVGSVLCWNGQPMGNVISIAQHENMPYSSFVILDRTFDINLQGQNVIINPPPGMSAQVSGQPLGDKFIAKQSTTTKPSRLGGVYW